MPSGAADDELYAHVGARVRALRKARGMTMQDVVDAGFVGGKAHLSGLERGHVKPNLATLARLAECFGVPLRDLFPPASVDRSAILDRVRALDDDELRVVSAMLDLLGR